MISIGITYRTDLCRREIHTIEQFLDYIATEHPVVVDLVKSGRLDDTNSYRSYMYETRQHYSSDGWFIIGDAGDTVDPLYSHGLALISMQAQQVGEAIRREHKGEPIDEFVTDLDIAFTTMHRLATREITSLYEVMHDPLRCHLRMHLAILLMFRLAVPLIFNGYMWDPIGIKIQSFSEAKRHGSRSRPLEAADRRRRLGTAQPLGRQLSQGAVTVLPELRLL